MSFPNCRWLHHLNEYGVCLLTDVPTERGYIKKVLENPLSFVYNIAMFSYSSCPWTIHITNCTVNVNHAGRGKCRAISCRKLVWIGR